MISFVIFVEGATDNLFINKIFNEKLSLLGKNYSIVEYSNMEKKKIKNYIRSINSTPNFDYIFITDQDGRKNKVEKILKEFPFLDKDKIFISIYEIESWIIAGISDKLLKKYKVKPILYDTSTITKEIFNTFIPKRMFKNEFIAYILDDYDTKKAIELNPSFKVILDYLFNKKAS